MRLYLGACICILVYAFVFGCMRLYLGVCVCIWVYAFVFGRMRLYLVVCVCIGSYAFEFGRMCMFVVFAYIFRCIRILLGVCLILWMNMYGCRWIWVYVYVLMAQMYSINTKVSVTSRRA